MSDKKRVLVADDDASIRHAVSLKLTAAGLDVTVAVDGEEGLRLALEHEPELMIVDYAMPYMTGYDLCRELRKHERMRSTPVIVLTAMEQDIDTTLAAELGVVRFMTKPFSPRELLASSQELLGLRPCSPSGSRDGGGAP